MTLKISNISDLPSGLDPEMETFLSTVRDRLVNIEAVQLPVFSAEELNQTTARLFNGALVRCSNGDAGSECLAYCNGFTWKVISLGSTVSSS